ncbi:tetraspanin-13 isoform X2 [Octopus sinensis]|uniref:Tetraspanin-13 isoform X2 n=1 Tax=Octopus sinensis TaxID=2607531 RepID=A0A6P7T8L4_9MOLL|nr:tetraspanin-13 isoform X2 [Octopus sinensis]
MVCGGFACSKNALAALNILYILVAFILIGVAAYGRASAVVTSLTLVGSIIACGVFLFLIAIIGFIGALRHHQVLLFFYMIILFLLFLIQFSLACACLAMNDAQKDSLAIRGWKLAGNKTRYDVQYVFNCCGLQEVNAPVLLNTGHPVCSGIPCCENNSECCTGKSSNLTCPCQPCLPKLKDRIHQAFTVTGAIGLFFSFTEILGVWITVRYRNQKDPRANPNAFL